MIDTRPSVEIQRAHDMFVQLSILIEDELVQKLYEGLDKPDQELDNELDKELQAMKHDLHVAADVLCWVLLHAYNPHFACNLQTVKDMLEERGYEVVDTGKLNYPPAKVN